MINNGLEIRAFGDALLATGDLDPIYIAAHRSMGGESASDRGRLAAWMVAYWCFYDAGAACYLAEQGPAKYWGAMLTAAENRSPAPDGGRWPRGRERRHFRGAAAELAVEQLAHRYARPIALVEQLGAAGPAAQSVMSRARAEHLFGPWIAFKIADMIERVAGFEVDFGDHEAAPRLFFRDPLVGALMTWNAWHDRPLDALLIGISESDAVAEVVREMMTWWRATGAPPTDNRGCNLQEVETVLCKWKSHARGRYPVGTDIAEIRHGLARWTTCSSLAQLFESQMPERVAAAEVAS